MNDPEKPPMFESMLQFSAAALKSVVLINGAAAISVLSFAGHIVSKGTTSVDPLFAFALLYFGSGVLFGAMATGAAYATQYAYYHFGQFIGVVWHWLAGALIVASYTTFGIGCILCYNALLS